MTGLEANSHGARAGAPDPRVLASGRARHSGCEVLHRHRHDLPFAAVVLRGHYVEAGDTGLHRVAPGDVIVHHPYESHLDRFDSGGAEVLTLTLTGPVPEGALRRIADPDLIVRLAERDPIDAADRLIQASVALPPSAADWPELLALDLLADPGRSLGAWARQCRLHPGTIARGFRQQFGITAAAFRANARALGALRDLRLSAAPLSNVAADHGFADQAHMTRTIGMITGQSPGRLRAISRRT